MPLSDHTLLASDLTTKIKGKNTNDDDFDALARRIFTYQYQNNTAYRNYCDQLGSHPDEIGCWQDIPAVPTDAFKFHNHPLRTTPPEVIRRTFHTSGTTGEVKGHHYFPSLDLYGLSITEGWKRANLPISQHPLILTPTPDAAPHSSLSHMMGVLTDTWSGHAQWGLSPTGEIETSTMDAITHAIDTQQPLGILGTALAFLLLFDQLPIPHRLPEGSWAMETGGYKGSQRNMEKQELYTLFQKKLNLAPNAIINEYSMTELSSQFYTRGLEHPHRGPHWTRIRIINPATGTDAPPGQPGYLVIYDLANLHSVLAIQTQDIAIAHDSNTFTLLGRDPSAIPRGCSRSIHNT